MESVAERRLARARVKIATLESMLEDKTRALFVANRELDDRNRFLEDVLRCMAGALVLVDEEFRILMVNQRLTAMTGRSEEELVGAPVQTIIPDAGTYGDEDRSTAAEEDTHMIGPDGEVPIALTHSRLRGDRPGFVYVAIDARERKAAEARLRQAQEKLLVASRAAGMAEIATGVIHNIGNVLGAVNVELAAVRDRHAQSRVGSVEKLASLLAGEGLASLAAGPKGAQIPAFMEKIAASLRASHDADDRSLTALSRHVEHIAHVVASQQQHAGAAVVVRALELRELLAELESLARPRADACRIALHLPDPGGLEVLTDRHLVVQILGNLVLNAIDAAAGRSDPTVHVEIDVQPESWRVRVRDNGIGIRAEDLERVFEHGFTTKHDGHGFGLHASANAATQMGGRLTVSSPGPGLGATFELALPQPRAEAA